VKTQHVPSYFLLRVFVYVCVRADGRETSFSKTTEPNLHYKCLHRRGVRWHLLCINYYSHLLTCREKHAMEVKNCAKVTCLLAMRYVCVVGGVRFNGHSLLPLYLLSPSLLPYKGGEMRRSNGKVQRVNKSFSFIHLLFSCLGVVCRAQEKKAMMNDILYFIKLNSRIFPSRGR